MFKKKIAYQLTAGFVMIVLASMLILGTFFSRLFYDYAVESREQTMLHRAHSIAEIVSEISGDKGFRGMGGFMRFLNTMTDSDVWILDSNGEPWNLGGMGMGIGGSAGQNHMTSTQPLPHEAEAVVARVMAGEDSISKSFSKVYDEPTLTVGVPISSGNSKVVGVVLLHAPVTGVSDLISYAIRILLISLGAALVAAVGLGVAYSRRFTRPLQQMNRVAMAMAKGNYDSRTHIHREDEFGQLGNSLDKLAAELGESIDLLYQEKGKLSDVIASISEGIVSFDAQGTPLSSNGKLAEIMGCDSGYSNACISADFTELGMNEVLGRVMGEKTPQALVRIYKGKHLKFTLSPIVDNHQAVTGAVALVQDISESEKLEQLRRDFVANVSHEFRTPLTVIKGSLEALADGTVTEPQAVARYISRLQSETRGLERLVGDLLDLSRLQAETISLHLEPVNLPELLADTLKGIREIAEKKDIRIAFDAGSGIPPIQGDYDRLRQLFIIFLDNAVKYSPAGSSISLTVALEDQVTVRIEDQGEGIAPEELPYIWDRFYQADRSREGHGTGLGLAIAARLIALHKASVSVSSRIGSGTAFTLVFPLNFY